MEPTATPERSPRPARRAARPQRQAVARAERPAPRPRPQPQPVARAEQPTRPRAQRPAPAPAPTRPPRLSLSINRPFIAPNAPLTCYGQLEAADIRFERVDRDLASGIQFPVRLKGPIGGIEVAQHGVKPDKRGVVPGTVVDCRLALRLLDWAKVLRRARVRRIEHYSTYRPGARVGGGRAVSGHAHGLALDAALFHLEDGSVVDVLTDWQSRKGDPCPQRRDEAWPSRLLRNVVCEAVEQKLFQVVITPHHDSAHENHVHLELRPDVDWTYVR